METSRDQSTESFQSIDDLLRSRSERTFVRALEAGLEGHPGKMQQLLRQVLRRPPAALSGDPDLITAMGIVTSQAVTPLIPETPRKSRAAWDAPRRDENHRYFESDSFGVADSSPSALMLDERPPQIPVLDESTHRVIDALVRERTSSSLERWGVQPARTVLFVGEPGTGKTLTARWIAGQLGKPLVVLNLAAVMSHELGRSAKNLTDALSFARHSDVVLFIDEFDAVASARAESSDVGEMRRLVNVLLMALDQWETPTLLIAATNHRDLLDPAIHRRFDETVEFQHPDRDTVARLWCNLVPELADSEANFLAAASEAMTGADIERSVRRARRAAALADHPLGWTDLLRALQLDRGDVDVEQRDRLILALSEAGFSQRDIGASLGVSHTLVGRSLKRRADAPKSRRTDRTQSTMRA